MNLNLIQKNKECLCLQIETDLLFSFTCGEMAHIYERGLLNNYQQVLGSNAT